MAQEIELQTPKAKELREQLFPNNQYKIMLGKETLEKLERACIRETYTLKSSELIRIALRRYKKSGPDLSQIEPGLTTGGQPRTFQLHNLPRYDEDIFRQILTWFLDTQVTYVKSIMSQIPPEEAAALATAKISWGDPE